MNKIISVFRGSQGPMIRNALGELELEIKKQGMSLSQKKYWVNPAGEEDDSACPLILMGLADEALVSRVLGENAHAPPLKRESLAIHSCRVGEKRKALVVSGADNTGLMYAIYELADCIRCEGMEVFSKDIHIMEEPENRVRGVDRYIMNHLDEEWFYSEKFWEAFLKKLARSRFNRFTLIAGFDTSYLTPPYPFFVEVPGFKDVRVKNLSVEKRDYNLKTLHNISALCEENGIVFSLGSWQQSIWTENQESLIENMPEDEDAFTEYCAQGIKLLLEKCPGIGAIQFRVNFEAGITNTGRNPEASGFEERQKQGSANVTNTNDDFWNRIVDSIASLDRPIKLDLRAKGVTNNMINHALSSGLDISIPTKYWCEHAALPYHISKLRTEEIVRLNDENASRRYSYGDMLKKPRSYDIIYRLWNYGSINLFLWADPDYCSRFSRSMSLGEAGGFEVNSPLALKGGMEVYAEKAWFIHREASLRTYQWEDERYWAFYLVFGRYGYNSGTSRDIISREFRIRFGPEGDYVLKAYESASKVLPFITTTHFPVHPSLHYWPELYPGAALFPENNYDKRFKQITYASALPSDEELFYSVAAFIDDEIAACLKPRYSPLWSRNYLHKLAEEIRLYMDKAGCTENSKGEKLSMWVDFSMIALLADFHSWKTAAAYYLYLHQKNPNKELLEKSYIAMLNAGQKWEELSAIGSRFYHEDLQFNAGGGTSRHKNWQFRLEAEVKRDIAALEDLLRSLGEKPEHYRQNLNTAYYSMMEESPLRISCDVPLYCNMNEDFTVKAAVDPAGEPSEIYLNYRHTDHTEGEYIHVPMNRKNGMYEAVIPGSYIAGDYDLIVYISGLDREKRAVIFPGINNDKYPFPYFLIKTGKAR